MRPRARPIRATLTLAYMTVGSKGGRRRTVYSPDGLKHVPAPETALDPRDLLAQSMVDVRMGRMDPKCGTTLAYMAVAALKAMEVSAESAPRIYPDIYQGPSEQDVESDSP